MNVTGIIDAINKPNTAPEDYIGDDGLLYCGKCHTPKQMRGEGILSGKILSTLCDCRKAENEAEEANAKRVRAYDLRIHCLPSEAMHRKTFPSASSEKHIAIAQRYVDRWQKVYKENIGLCFWGNTGTGKTFAALCIANALIDKEIPVLYFSTVDLISQMMNRETNRDELMKRIRNIPLLILDDVGAERDTPFSREQLCSVIDARGEAGKPLIVTTNYTLDDLNGKGNDPVMQRIFNRLKALCVPVAVTGASKRDSVGAEKMKIAKELLAL